jgi:hypothetical protein
MIQRRTILALSLALSVAVAIPVAAQGDAPSRPDAAQLESLCRENAPDEEALGTCLAVVHRYLVPGSGPSVGDVATDPNMTVTLAGVDWAPIPTGDHPAEGQQLVAVLVRYQASEGADYSASDDWQAHDQDDVAGARVEPSRDPQLTGGQLEPGQTAEGWLTFELPAGVESLRLTYRDGLFGTEHDWVVAYDAEAVPTTIATPAPTPKPTRKPKPTKAPSYAKVNDRTWAKIVKSPDRYEGKRYQVWACISQFDAATGPDTFRAEASNKREQYWFLDSTNALFTGDESRLDDFVEDDVVWMNVVGGGSFEYETTLGGSMTVPVFVVISIKRKGSC